MVGTDMGERPADRKRKGFSGKVIVFILTMAILISTSLYLARSGRLPAVWDKIQEIRAQTIRAQTKETTVVYDTEALTEIETEAPDKADNSLYTADSVGISKRSHTNEIGMDLDDTWTQNGENVRRVYLTFDDGPSSNTGRILDILAEYDVKATFFVVGREEEEYQPLYNRIVEEGHTLGMHSYSHRYQEIYQSVDSYAQDLSRLQEFLYDTTGVWCRYCRFPGGSSNTVSRVDMHDLIAYLDEQDITYFDWNISSGDAVNDYISADAIVRNCLSQIPKNNESIILMHDASNKNTTVQALPTLIEKILAMENTVIVPITEDAEPIQHISNE